ncbi:DUF5694 domain-containing protein [Spirosoma fluviale]|uniref:Uncharacterized protein n=1 Tax=Spirosoma fluviale TaxID=1597977 RepID=A0A286GAY3_9BACT|nr:DUF5694 domain-containing protein [Spirosoma fluviale]SOD92638.1 hypothetical protein SAMN06269250_4081 [Spirosoma fluviale]
MTHLYPKFLLFILSSLLVINGNSQNRPSVQVMLVGFDHLSQLYNQQPKSDVYSAKKQAEINQLTTCFQSYAPDMIMVEVDPSEQPQIDSLYALYLAGKLTLNDLPSGRSETYQIGFALAKRLKHKRIYCVDHYEATSQSLLTEGTNIDLYKQALQQFQGLARPLKKQVQQDSLSVYEYIRKLNQPDMITLTHRLFYNLPALVVDGEFSKTATNTMNVSHIDKRYIGAEFISLFYNRNLKIYSNALISQRQYQGKKLLLIFGQPHVGVLQELFRENPNYSLVSPLNYCK